MSISCSVSDNTLLPFITGKLVDILNNIHNPKDGLNIFMINLLYGIFFWICVEVVNRIKGIISARFIPRFEADIRLSALNTVLRHDYKHFMDRKNVNAFSYRVDDLPRSMYMIFDNATFVFLPVIFSILASSFFLMEIHYLLSIIFVSWLGLHIYLMIKLSAWVVKFTQDTSFKRSRVQSSITDIMLNNFIIKAFFKQKHEVKYVSKIQNIEMNANKKGLMYIELAKGILGALAIISVSILLFVAAHLWKAGIITTGDVIFMIHSSMSIMTTMWYVADEIRYTLIELGIARQSLEIILNKVKGDILIDHSISYSENHVPIPVNWGEKPKMLNGYGISFANVTFGYFNTENIFSDLSINIGNSESVGIVGASGSGKSTFINLIMGLYRPSKGQIIIGDTDVAELSELELRSLITVVPQTTSLFNRSISDNISYGAKNATKEKIIESAQKAHCDEFITALPDGYDTVIGDGGFSLSGGQAQRIGIARAILKDCHIVIIDEGTSSLDAITEEKIKVSLSYLMKGKTSIVIAHKLSTLKNLDRIIVMSHGKIVEEGNHAELISKNGHYFHMWSVQHGGVIK